MAFPGECMSVDVSPVSYSDSDSLLDSKGTRVRRSFHSNYFLSLLHLVIFDFYNRLTLSTLGLRGKILYSYYVIALEFFHLHKGDVSWSKGLPFTTQRTPHLWTSSLQTISMGHVWTKLVNKLDPLLNRPQVSSIGTIRSVLYLMIHSHVYVETINKVSEQKIMPLLLIIAYA